MKKIKDYFDFEKKELISLLLLLVIGFFLRIWRVGSYPPLLWDEASLGYNAFSILKTGRDEYGSFLPLIFKSFGDYKPGLYVYLAIPFVKIFGLSQLAVRLPAVILSSLTPFFLYLLVREIWENKKVALFSAFLLAFMPWHLHFSRGSWESNVLVFFLVLGSWLFIRKRYFGSLFSFLLSLWTYQGAKMMAPMILFGLVFFNWKELKGQWLNLKTKPKKLLPLLLVLLLMGAWFYQSFTGPAKNRLKVMGLFSYRRPVSEVEMIMQEDGKETKDVHYYLFHDEWLSLFKGSLSRYFNHLSPRFLAFEGDWPSPRHSAPYFGVIGHFNFVFFLLGFYLFLAKKQKFASFFILYWLLVSPLPAALSRDTVSSVRALPMVIPLSIFGGYGLANLKLKRFKKAILLVVALFFLVDFIYYSNLYYSHLVKRSPRDWLVGYQEMIDYVVKNQDKYQQVVVSDFYGQPYIYYLFYSKFPPEAYQAQANLVENQWGDVGKVEQIDHILFRPVSWQDLKSFSDSLVIFSGEELVRSGIEEGSEIMSKLIPLGQKDKKILFYAYEPEKFN